MPKLLAYTVRYVVKPKEKIQNSKPSWLSFEAQATFIIRRIVGLRETRRPVIRFVHIK